MLSLYEFQDLYRVYQAVSKMADFLDSVEQHTGKHRMLLMQLFSNPIKVSFLSAFLRLSFDKVVIFTHE